MNKSRNQVEIAQLKLEAWLIFLEIKSSYGDKGSQWLEFKSCLELLDRSAELKRIFSKCYSKQVVPRFNDYGLIGLSLKEIPSRYSVKRVETSQC